MIENSWGYIGTTNVTKNNRTCQSWSVTKPHGPSSDAKIDANYPDGWIPSAENYCRYPWGDNPRRNLACYTTDPKVRWEYCDIPPCTGKVDRI